MGNVYYWFDVQFQTANCRASHQDCAASCLRIVPANWNPGSPGLRSPPAAWGAAVAFQFKDKDYYSSGYLPLLLVLSVDIPHIAVYLPFCIVGLGEFRGQYT